MDDNAKQVSSYQLDQEILDARGITITVEEVATLPTCRYAERVAALQLTDADLAFLKGLRRRIKNRLASQNSRRRSMEHLRRLSRELRVVRARRAAALAERRALLLARDQARARCLLLRRHLTQVLQTRSDPAEVPSIDIERIPESHSKDTKKIAVTETKTPLLADCFNNKIERDKHIFECRIDKIVQNSVNHMYKGDRDKKKVFAKTVFIANEKNHSNVKSMVVNQTDLDGDLSIEGSEEEGVLNLSVKTEKRKQHGRKQSAPRRIPYACLGGSNSDDVVLDLKIKKENQ